MAAAKKAGKAAPVVAKHCTKCDETKPANLFGPNKARKDGLQTYCRACMRNLFAAKQYDKARWAINRDAESERNKKYRADNADRLAPIHRAKAEKRRETHPGLIRTHNIARKHGEKRATPSWADMTAINALYAEAKRLASIDGIERHVDHVIPLKHSCVCGLHVAQNMRVISAAENMRKHNAFEVM